MTIEEKLADFITPEEAAEILGVKVGTLAVWRYSGTRGPSYTKVGGIVLYRKSAILEWLESCERSCKKAKKDPAKNAIGKGHE